MTTFDLQRFFDGEADHERRRNLIDEKFLNTSKSTPVSGSPWR